jgi:hypothetical protein
MKNSEEWSFSEEKEPKRLLLSAPSAADGGDFKRSSCNGERIKVFLLLFLQKKKTLAT